MCHSRRLKETPSVPMIALGFVRQLRIVKIGHEPHHKCRKHRCFLVSLRFAFSDCCEKRRRLSRGSGFTGFFRRSAKTFSTYREVIPPIGVTNSSKEIHALSPRALARKRSACFCGCIPADGLHGIALRLPVSRNPVLYLRIASAPAWSVDDPELQRLLWWSTSCPRSSAPTVSTCGLQ